jgi:hypothetical protein
MMISRGTGDSAPGCSRTCARNARFPESDGDRLLALARAAHATGDPILGRATRLATRRLRARLRFADALSLIREVLQHGREGPAPGRSERADGWGAEMAPSMAGGEPVGDAVDRGADARAAPTLARRHPPSRGLDAGSRGPGLEAAPISDAQPAPAPARYEPARLAALRYCSEPELAGRFEEPGAHPSVDQEPTGRGGAERTVVPGRPSRLRPRPLFGTILARHGDTARVGRLLGATMTLAGRAGRKDLSSPGRPRAGAGPRRPGSRELAGRWRNASASPRPPGTRRRRPRARQPGDAVPEGGALERAEEPFTRARVQRRQLGEDGPAAAA